MTIDKGIEAKILRYHFVEKWRTGTIAKQLGIHHSVIDRVLAQAGIPKVERSNRASIIDPYLPFIIQTLDEFPTLTAARLHEMVKQRGYSGGPSFFRQRISQLRPHKRPEAYLRLKTLPGEQAQVDWGHFGYIQIGKAKRPLMAFVMVLSWSRQIFLQFYLNQQMETFYADMLPRLMHGKGYPRYFFTIISSQRYSSDKEMLFVFTQHYWHYLPIIALNLGLLPLPVAMKRAGLSGQFATSVIIFLPPVNGKRLMNSMHKQRSGVRE